ncbi:Endothelin-converting enzyme 1 [Podila verticillata]|nr:Endothelin-converting enzyme 1 [Podila verticillata]
MPSKLILWITIGAAVQAIASGAPTNNNVICTTQQCVLAAADIIRDMNPDVDPCVTSTSMHPNRDNVLISPMSKSAGGGFIDTPRHPTLRIEAAYVSCMNIDKISSVGRKPLQEDTLKLVEMFPVSDSALATKSTVVPTSPNTDKRTLATTLAYFVSHDFDTPLNLSPATDVKNPDKTILTISENGLGLDFKGNYADAWITSVYQTTIASMFSLGDGPQNSTSATVLASWTDVAKDSLAEIGSSPEEMMDPLLTYNPMNVSQIAALAPSVDWPWLLEKALLPGMQVPEPLTVSSKDYLSRLEALLQKTSPKTMQNYLAWTMIRKNQDSLDSAYQQPMKDLD